MKEVDYTQMEVKAKSLVPATAEPHNVATVQFFSYIATVRLNHRTPEGRPREIYFPSVSGCLAYCESHNLDPVVLPVMQKGGAA